MPRRALRSRSLRRSKVRTPGGRQITRYERRKPSPAACGSCGGKLAGVPALRPSALGKLAKSSKRPTRPFGGNLCSACSREAMKVRIVDLEA